MTLKEWEEKMLALPEAAGISREHDQHQEGEEGFVPAATSLENIANPGTCFCRRCKIIRIKRRRTSLPPRSKCPGCGQLHFSIFTLCDDCRKKS